MFGVITTTMKLDLKKTRLVIVSFLCGFLLCAILISPPSTRQSTPRVVATGPLLATTQFQPQSAAVIWVAPQHTPFRPIRAEHDPHATRMELLLPGSRPSRNVDLIDTRYQPSIDLRDIR